MNALSNVRTISRKFDWLLLGSYLILVLIGLTMVFTTTYNDTESQRIWSFDSAFGRQLIWAGISLVLLVLAYSIDWSFWNSLSIPLYIIGLSFLLLTLFVGREINGAKAWIFLGPFSFQPGEFVKFSTAVMMASLLSPIKFRLDDIRSQLVALGIIIAPVILILLQPDPGSAVTFFSLLILAYRRNMPVLYYLIGIVLFLVLTLSLKFGYLVTMTLICLVTVAMILDFNRSRLISSLIFISLLLTALLLFQFEQALYALLLNIGVLTYLILMKYSSPNVYAKLRIAAGVIVLSGISFVSQYAFDVILKPHQKDRINVWLNPEDCDPRGSLYNLLQSKLAISSGGLQGKGFMNGTFTRYNYVPAQTTDFIFSSIGEEQGFIGSASVVMLFLVMVIRLIQIGESSSSRFALNYCYAAAGFVFFHFFINIGMTLGLAPVIGIPLPFISKGGTALMSFSIMVGVALKISRSKNI